MKTKTFLLICLLMGITTYRLSAQWPTPPDGTKSLVYTFEWQYSENVICNGINDILSGLVSFKETDLYKDGVLVKGNAIAYGDLVSSNTGEIFKLRDNCKGWGDVDEYGVFVNMAWHSNIDGDNGSHYIGFYSLSNGIVTIDKITCPENIK